MSTVAEELVLQLGVQMGQLQSGMQEATSQVASSTDRVEQSAREMTQSLENAAAKGGAAMRGLGARIKTSSAEMKESIEKVHKSFAGLAEFMMAGLAVDKVVEQLEKFGDAGTELEHLSQKTGMTAQQLSHLKYAAEESEVSFQAVTKGTQKLAQTMVLAREGSITSVAALQGLGVTSADLANKNFTLQDAMEKVTDKIANAPAGYQKTGLAMQAFGRSGADMIPILNNGAEGLKRFADEADKAGYTMTESDMKAAQQASDAFIKLHEGTTVLNKAFASGLAPAAKALGQQFLEGSKDGGALNEMFRGLGVVIKAVVTAFEALYAVAKTVILAIINWVMHAIDKVKGWGTIIADVMSGNFSRIKADYHEMQAQQARDTAAGADMMKETWKNFGDGVKQMWGDVDEAKKKAEKPATTQINIQKTTGVAKPMDLMKKQLEDEEAAQKISYDKRAAFELRFWQQKLATVRKGSAEYAAIYQQIIKLTGQEATAHKHAIEQQAVQMQQLLKINADYLVKKREMEAAELRAEMDQKVRLGEMTKQEELAQLKQQEDATFAVQRRALVEQLQQDNLKVAQRAALNARLYLLDQQHNNKIKALNRQSMDDLASTWENALAPVSAAFQTSINGIIQGTQTWHQAMGKIFQSILQQFISMGVKMATHWIAVEAAKTQATLAGNAIRSASDSVASKQSIASIAISAIKWVTAKAVEVIANVWASISAIPYVGPFLAPAMAIAAGAAVIGLTSKIASAAGGWDNVPHDQLAMIHKQEMILPATIANPLRQAVAGGGLGGGRSETHIHIHAMDPESFEDFAQRNPGSIASWAKHAERNGWST